MPAQDRVWCDQALATQRSGQPLDEGGEDRPVCPVHARSWVGAAQDGYLVPEHEEFDVLGGGRAAHQQDQPEYVREDQVEQPQRHVGDHAQLTITAGQRPRPDFWHPTGDPGPVHLPCPGAGQGQTQRRPAVRDPDRPGRPPVQGAHPRPSARTARCGHGLDNRRLHHRLAAHRRANRGTPAAHLEPRRSRRQPRCCPPDTATCEGLALGPSRRGHQDQAVAADSRTPPACGRRASRAAQPPDRRSALGSATRQPRSRVRLRSRHRLGLGQRPARLPTHRHHGRSARRRVDTAGAAA